MLKLQIKLSQGFWWRNSLLSVKLSCLPFCCCDVYHDDGICYKENI